MKRIRPIVLSNRVPALRIRIQLAASKSLSFLLTLTILVSGCAHCRPNAPLHLSDTRSGYRFRNAASQTNSPDLLLILAFSGGGTRAAAVSYGVLEELARTPVGQGQEQHRLLDDVDLISSVSGSSFTAAYYALWGDRLFMDFEPLFLKNHIQTSLWLRFLAPWNQIRLASPQLNSSDLAAEYYDQLLFKGATFGDLADRPNRPFLIIGATDAASGAQFQFTQDQFDLVGSDLSKFRISRAVAASTALPSRLSPIVIQNYSVTPQHPKTDRIGQSNFIHLVDGGIADHLGANGLADKAFAFEGLTNGSPTAAVKNAKRIALIIVDAHVGSDYGWDVNDRVPGVDAIFGSTSTTAISPYACEAVELYHEILNRLARERIQDISKRTPEFSTYVVNLHFNHLENDGDRRFFNSVPTNFQLPSKTVDRLRQLAAHQLASNEEFCRLVHDLGGHPTSSDSTNRQQLTTLKKP